MVDVKQIHHQFSPGHIISEPSLTDQDERKRKASHDRVDFHNEPPGKRIKSGGSRTQYLKSDSFSLIREPSIESMPASGRSCISSGTGPFVVDDDSRNRRSYRAGHQGQGSRSGAQNQSAPSTSRFASETPEIRRFLAKLTTPSHHRLFVDDDDDDDSGSGKTPVGLDKNGEVGNQSLEKSLQQEKAAQLQKSREMRLSNLRRREATTSPSVVPPAQGAQVGSSAYDQISALWGLGLEDHDEADPVDRPELRGAESMQAYRREREARERREAVDTRRRQQQSKSQVADKMSGTSVSQGSVQVGQTEQLRGPLARPPDSQHLRAGPQSGHNSSAVTRQAEPQPSRGTLEQMGSKTITGGPAPELKMAGRRTIATSQQQSVPPNQLLRRPRTESANSMKATVERGLPQNEGRHFDRALENQVEYNMVSHEPQDELAGQRDIEDDLAEAESRKRDKERAQQERQEYLDKINRKAQVQAMRARQQEEQKTFKAADEERNRHLAELRSTSGDAHLVSEKELSVLPGSKQAPAAAIAEAAERREERIKINKARNERRRQSEQQDRLHEEHTESRSVQFTSDKSLVSLSSDSHAHVKGSNMSGPLDDGPSPSAPIVSSLGPDVAAGPVSLNSLAGQAAVERLSKDSQLPKGGAHRRRLGEILPEDIKILRWRQGGMLFPNISHAFEQTFGRPRAAKTLSDRYKQVHEAIEKAAVPRDVLDLVEAGVLDAREELNRLVHGQAWRRGDEWSKPALAVRERPEPPPPRQALRRFQPQLTAGDNVSSELPSPRQGSPRPRSHLAIGDDVVPTPRPQFGGKTMSQEVLWHYLDMLALERAEESEEAGDDADESASTVTLEYSEFTYQVMRREISAAELNDGDTIDDQQWTLCGGLFSTPREANDAAMRQLFRTQRKTAYSADASFSVDVGYDDDGMARLQQRANGQTVVQVCVRREIRTFADGFLPRRDAEYAPRTIYLVKVSMSQEIRSDDGLFNEARTVTSETVLDNKIFTAVELANDRAIDEFVHRTFRSNSAHLKIRDLERQEKREECKRTLPELDEDALFKAEFDGHDGHTVEIRVEEGTLAGPRNI